MNTVMPETVEKECAAELPIAVISLHTGGPSFPGQMLADYSPYRCMSVVIPEDYDLLRGKTCTLEGPFDFPGSVTEGKLITHASLTLRDTFQVFDLTPSINIDPCVIPRIIRLEFIE